MTDRSHLPSAHEARDSLASVVRMRAAGTRRGIFPRWILASKTLWVGLMLVGFAYEWQLRFLLLLLGGVGVLLLRRYRDAIPHEFHGRGYLAAKITIILSLIALFIFARIAWRDYGLAWAPIVAGAVASVGLFVWLDIKFRSLRENYSGEPQR